MGLDLTLLPAYSMTAGDMSLDILRLFEAGDLWDPIEAIESSLVPVGFRSWLALHQSTGCRYDGERTFGETKTDAYGKRLRMVGAGDLVKLAEHPAWRAHPRNVAALAYLRALPADWPVVLYWH